MTKVVTQNVRRETAPSGVPSFKTLEEETTKQNSEHTEVAFKNVLRGVANKALRWLPR